MQPEWGKSLVCHATKTGVFTLTHISISVLIACSIVAAPTAASILVGAMQLGNAVMRAVTLACFQALAAIVR
jgi:hypothetical protein